MDKSWMRLGRCHPDYFRGCEEFLNFAWSHRTPDLGECIFCPCVRCNNLTSHYKYVVRKHIQDYGITRSYTRWTKHGEPEEVNSMQEEVTNATDRGDMHGMLRDSFPESMFSCGDGEVPQQSNTSGPSQDGRVADEPNEDAQMFYKLLKEAETPLYPGCTTASKLSFLVELLHLKCSNGLSNKGFDDHLALLRRTYPESRIPKTYYEAKKQLRDLGMDCIKIDACPNDCMLYWKEDRDKDKCDTCGESRWISLSGACQSAEELSGKQRSKRKAAKVLRYFPLKPRLQRLYMSSKTAKDMIWHDVCRTKDGVLRHPADSKAWETLDKKHQAFGSEPRNVRLGLASDGFNPFGVMGTSHSTWPVFVVPYNLPPWMCMKQPYFIMCLLIPGPKGPGNNIDVYLRPLIEELKELWTDGIETYDAYSKQNFQMRAALLWTINDFPAYANLSGWSTKGYLACPCCHKDTKSVRLQNGKKNVYLGHRRFLPIKHRFRDNRSSFNGFQEKGTAPKPLTGDDVLRQLHGYHQITFGKEQHAICGEKRRQVDNELPHNWKKISIFFELPYWKDLLLRHNLDVMHTEKNNSESWVGTLLNIEGKTKDNLKAREDLKLMGIRGPLHPEARGNNKFYLPPAKYTMSLAERRKICQFFRDLKVPDSYSSNISRRVQVQQCNIPGLKSHDWHVLIQQLLPVAVRGILHDDVTRALVEFSDFYRQLCSKTLRIGDLETLEEKMYLTLCKMEMIFPPSFFDIMTHLPVHLAQEARIAGPVHYRWMYPIERYLYTLKRYVRNKSRPEGSIAQGYLTDELLTFCSRYLSAEVNTKFNQVGRNSDDDGTTSGHELPIFEVSGRPLGKETFRTLEDSEWEEARMYVLSNCDEILPFIEKHKQTIRDDHGGNIPENELDCLHAARFGSWFERHVRQMKQDGQVVKKDIEILSYGPRRSVSCRKGYIVNGFRFHTTDHEKNRNTQNSGVCVNVETSTTDSVDYYGRLDEVMVLQYRDGNQVVLFKCHWWDIGESIKKRQDAFGFTSLNFTRTIYKTQPFILAKQAHQVFYLQDNKDKNRRIVLKMQARDTYSLGTTDVEPIQQGSSNTDNNATIAAETVQDFGSWTRNEIEGEEVIRSTDGRDEDDPNDDSDSDHSDHLSDCERDDLV